jgi:superfamily I DNA and RNA helicase
LAPSIYIANHAAYPNQVFKLDFLNFVGKISAMEATFKIHTTELSQEIIEKIRQFISVNGESEVVINIRPKKKKGFPKETKEAFFARLDRAIDNLDQKQNRATFTVEEFETFAEPKL